MEIIISKVQQRYTHQQGGDRQIDLQQHLEKSICQRSTNSILFKIILFIQYIFNGWGENIYKYFLRKGAKLESLRTGLMRKPRRSKLRSKYNTSKFKTRSI